MTTRVKIRRTFGAFPWRCSCDWPGHVVHTYHRSYDDALAYAHRWLRQGYPTIEGDNE